MAPVNLLKKLAGVGVFIGALAAAVAVTKFYTRYAAAPPPAEIVHRQTAPVAPAAAASDVDATMLVDVTTRLVTLDFDGCKSYTTLIVERDRRRPAPESLWVWTYFFTPDASTGQKMWAADPVEIRRPFAAGGDSVTINADNTCSWCDDPRAPQSGYYARVRVSTVSKEAARLRDEEMSDDITTATPVIVQAASKKSR